MRIKNLIIVNVIVSLLFFCFFIYWLYSPKIHTKIAYVRTAVLVDKYLGTKEAQKKFEKKTSDWQAGGDTLKKRLENFIDSLQKIGKTQNLDKQTTELLEKKQKEFANYQNYIQQNMQVEEQKAMEGIFKQVNSFIEQYAKDKGIDLILGTTQQGSLLYGHKALDITDDIVDALNKQYRK